MSTIDDYEALFDSKYLRWFDIEGKGDIVCTIEKVEREELTLRGGAKKKAPVISIKNGSKPLVLNRTNADTIAELHGNRPSGWPGKKIVLYVTQTMLKKKLVNCIRVKGANGAS